MSIRIRGAVGRLHHVEPCVLEMTADRLTPLRVAITDQYAVLGEGAVYR